MLWKAASFDEAAKRRIAKAAAFEKRLRLEAVIGIDQEVACFNLRQIEVRDIVHLEFSENRLVSGEIPKLDDLVALIFMLSTDRYFFKGRYARKVGRILKDNESVRIELIAFFNASFNDMPSIGSSNKAVADSFDSSVSIMTLVDSLASNYGWSLDEVLNLSLSTSLQLLQRITQRNLGDNYSPRNGITQQAKSDELKKLNQNG
jgi:hypothetical protein